MKVTEMLIPTRPDNFPVSSQTQIITMNDCQAIGILPRLQDQFSPEKLPYGSPLAEPRPSRPMKKAARLVVIDH